jgi:hypothetical protein
MENFLVRIYELRERAAELAAAIKATLGGALLAMQSSEVVLEMSRATAEQGARRRATGVYNGLHEDREPPRNAAMASAAVFKTASQTGPICKVRRDSP